MELFEVVKRGLGECRGYKKMMAQHKKLDGANEAKYFEAARTREKKKVNSPKDYAHRRRMCH